MKAGKHTQRIDSSVEWNLAFLTNHRL